MFSQELANLARAASRAGNDGGRSGGRDGGDRGGGRGDGRGGYHDRNHNSSHSSSSNTRDRYDGSGGRGRGGRGRHHNYRSDDRHRSGNSHRDDYNNPRKRTRNNDDYDKGGSPDRHRSSNNGRDYHGRGGGSYRGGGGGRGGRGGRFGGRGSSWQPGSPSKPLGPLSELVEKVADKYKASKEDDGCKNNADAAVSSSTTTTPTKAATATTPTPTTKRRHVALLFLTIDDLPHEHIWREWLKSGSKHYLTEGGKEEDDESKDIDASPSSSSSSSSSPYNMPPPLVSVLCHAKHPDRIRSAWLRKRHLLRRNLATNETLDGFHSRCPEWGSINITRAMIDLMEDGLRLGVDEEDGSLGRYAATPGDDENDDLVGHGDSGGGADGTSNAEAKPSAASSNCAKCKIPPIDRFIFVSESCLPVTTLKELESALFGPSDAPEQSHLYDKSWINARSTPNNGYAQQQQWDEIRQTDIPDKLVWKADQWCVLTRAHAQAVSSIPAKYLEGRHLWPAMKRCRASDEMYFPTALSILGELHRPPGGAEVDNNDSSSSKTENCAGGGIRRRKITYCDWSMGARNPASFTSKDWKEVVGKARGEGCLLARKFVSYLKQHGRSGGRSRGSNNAEVGGADGLISVEDWISAVAKRGST